MDTVEIVPVRPSDGKLAYPDRGNNSLISLTGPSTNGATGGPSNSNASEAPPLTADRSGSSSSQSTGASEDLNRRAGEGTYTHTSGRRPGSQALHAQGNHGELRGIGSHARIPRSWGPDALGEALQVIGAQEAQAGRAGQDLPGE